MAAASCIYPGNVNRQRCICIWVDRSDAYANMVLEMQFEHASERGSQQGELVSTRASAIRPWATGRKNWLFAGTMMAGQRAAAIMSLIQSAKLNGNDPCAYLRDALACLPTHPAREILSPSITAAHSISNLGSIATMPAVPVHLPTTASVGACLDWWMDGYVRWKAKLAFVQPS